MSTFFLWNIVYVTLTVSAPPAIQPAMVAAAGAFFIWRIVRWYNGRGERGNRPGA